jgi:hypothetical protein
MQYEITAGEIGLRFKETSCAENYFLKSRFLKFIKPLGLLVQIKSYSY